MVTMWFEGIEELNKVTADLEAAKGGVGAGGSAVVRKYGLQVERTAKIFAPVDTGHLKGSIGPPVYEGDGRFGAMSVTITAHANYAAYVEYGTRNMAPHAFMGPALDRHGGEFVAACEALAAAALTGGGSGTLARARAGR